jgi:hypothetical protein
MKKYVDQSTRKRTKIQLTIYDKGTTTADRFREISENKEQDNC